MRHLHSLVGCVELNPGPSDAEITIRLDDLTIDIRAMRAEARDERLTITTKRNDFIKDMGDQFNAIDVHMTQSEDRIATFERSCSFTRINCYHDYGDGKSSYYGC